MRIAHHHLAALAGGLLWLIGLAVRSPLGEAGSTELLVYHLLTFAPLVLVPLSAPLLLRGEGIAGWGARAATCVAPFTAAIAWGAHLFLPRGPLAAALIGPWLLTTATISLSAAWWLLGVWREEGVSGLRARPGELTLGVGMLYLTGGAVWMILSRLGLRPQGFPDIIVLLTAIHFHYAGFVAPLLAAMTGRVLRDAGRHLRAHTAACVGVILGTPLIAIGIATSKPVEVFSTLWFTASVMAVGLLTFAALRHLSGRARVLLAISALSSFGSMIAAAMFVSQHLVAIIPLSIADMAATHGIINALGFAGCGLLGWSLTADVFS